MQVVSLTPTRTFLVLEQGEEVVKTLTAYCETTEVHAGSISGIGAVTRVVCGYYALDVREYRFTTYPDLYEVVSLTANVALKDGKPFVHMHAVFSDAQNHTFGGHVASMVVGVTLEVFVDTYPTALHRQYDEATGLYLLVDKTGD